MIGHNPKVKEPDIRRAFKMNKRAEKFNLDLSDVNAHTLKIMEIIDEEKANAKPDFEDQIQEMMKNGRR